MIVFFLLNTLVVIALAVFHPNISERYLDDVWPDILPTVALIALGAAWVFVRRGQPFRAFLASSAMIGLLLISGGVGLYPNLIISTIDPAYNLTIFNAASADNTLVITLFFAVIGIPFVLLYTTGVYYIFRARPSSTATALGLRSPGVRAAGDRGTTGGPPPGPRPGVRPRLAAGIACGFGAAVVVIAQAWLLSIAVAEVFLGGAGIATVAPLLVVVALLALLRAPLLLAADAFAQDASSRVRGGLRADLTGHLLALGPAWTSRERTGELAGVATDGLDAVDAYVVGRRQGARGRSSLLSRLVIDPPTTLVLLFTADLVLLLASSGGRTRHH
jgi:hypothetical protein